MHSQGLRYEHAGIRAVAAQLPWWLPAVLLLLAAALSAGPARAGVGLRVEATPASDPIQAFVTVTDDATGAPLRGLGAGDFTVTLDGVAIQQPGFTLPPTQDPSQKVSVIFVMDYSQSVQAAALTAMQDAVTSFINAMNAGDFAAIIKFNRSNPDKASLVQPFTRIDGASGTSALIGAVMAPYPGNGTNLIDAINLAINHFSAPPMPLPIGPKAVIAITDGGDNASVIPEGLVTDYARRSSIPIFTIGVGTILGPDLLTRLAVQTGGDYLPAPSDPAIAAAYVTISELLNNEYLLTIQSSISDCAQHTLQVSVTGQANAASATFVRCVPPAPPPTPAPSGGGGGGAMGVVDLLAGLTVLVARRRRRT
jgi:von Willebrand factor type A domain